MWHPIDQANMGLVSEMLRRAICDMRRGRSIKVVESPDGPVLLTTKYGAIQISVAEAKANWPQKRSLIQLLTSKLSQAIALVKTRGRIAADLKVKGVDIRYEIA